MSRPTPRTTSLLLAASLAAACADHPTDPAASVAADRVPERWRTIASGETFTCTLDAEGAPYCWGVVVSGRVPRPTAVATAVRFDTLAAGEHHLCGLTAAGAAWCWGDNWTGKLGDGTDTSRFAPVRVLGGHVFTTISAGLRHSCAVDVDGAAWCWGTNWAGELGSPVRGSSAVPVRVSGGVKFRAIVAGNTSTCGVSRSGITYCWGGPPDGLGIFLTSNPPAGVDPFFVDTPFPVQRSPEFTSLSASLLNRCGITTGQDLYCWGQYFVDHEGGGYTVSWTPTPVAAGTHFTEVSSGRFHGCAVTTDAGAVCWGINQLGALGNDVGRCVDLNRDCLTTSLGRVQGSLKFRSISVGGAHSCALTTDGQAYCWGANDVYQLGSGPRDATSVPLRVGS